MAIIYTLGSAAQDRLIGVTFFAIAGIILLATYSKTFRRILIPLVLAIVVIAARAVEVY